MFRPTATLSLARTSAGDLDLSVQELVGDLCRRK